jgi:hypothetical protein
MKDWTWDNPRAFRDEVDRPVTQTARSGKVDCTGKRFFWYGTDDLEAKIVQPTCRQYTAGEFQTVRPLNWGETFDDNDNDENWVDPGALSGGRRRHGHVNDTDDVLWCPMSCVLNLSIDLKLTDSH